MPVKQQAGVRACCRLRDTREMTNIFLNIPVCEATPAGSQGGLDVLEKDVISCDKSRGGANNL